MAVTQQTESINDIQMASGELEYLCGDLFNGTPITLAKEQKLASIARRAVGLLREMQEFRKSLGLPKRPKVE